MDVIAFTKVALPWGWLGNMSPHPVVYRGEVYKTTEALFQCTRFAGHPDVREEIRTAPSPMGAKMIAKKRRKELDIEPDLQADRRVMKRILQLKLKHHPNLAAELKKTGDALIVEDCTARPHGTGLYWGTAKRGDVWVGENVLGKLWMEIRSEL
jgi:ribA/ribD-fused uncharacterized protein